MTCTAENFPAGNSGGACPDGTMRRSMDDGRHCEGDSCDADDCCVFTCANFDGTCRARSHWRFVLPLIHLTPESRPYSAPLFLKRQCDRTPGACPEGKAPRPEDDMHECEEREGDSHDGARVRAAPEPGPGPSARRRTRHTQLRVATMRLAFGPIGTALSRKISVFQPGSLKVAPISRPNAW